MIDDLAIELNSDALRRLERIYVAPEKNDPVRNDPGGLKDDSEKEAKDCCHVSRKCDHIGQAAIDVIGQENRTPPYHGHECLNCREIPIALHFAHLALV